MPPAPVPVAAAGTRVPAGVVRSTPMAGSAFPTCWPSTPASAPASILPRRPVRTNTRRRTRTRRCPRPAADPRRRRSRRSSVVPPHHPRLRAVRTYARCPTRPSRAIPRPNRRTHGTLRSRGGPRRNRATPCLNRNTPGPLPSGPSRAVPLGRGVPRAAVARQSIRNLAIPRRNRRSHAVQPRSRPSRVGLCRSRRSRAAVCPSRRPRPALVALLPNRSTPGVVRPNRRWAPGNCPLSRLLPAAPRRHLPRRAGSPLSHPPSAASPASRTAAIPLICRCQALRRTAAIPQTCRCRVLSRRTAARRAIRRRRAAAPSWSPAAPRTCPCRTPAVCHRNPTLAASVPSHRSLAEAHLRLPSRAVGCRSPFPHPKHGGLGPSRWGPKPATSRRKQPAPAVRTRRTNRRSLVGR